MSRTTQSIVGAEVDGSTLRVVRLEGRTVVHYEKFRQLNSTAIASIMREGKSKNTRTVLSWGSSGVTMQRVQAPGVVARKMQPAIREVINRHVPSGSELPGAGLVQSRFDVVRPTAMVGAITSETARNLRYELGNSNCGLVVAPFTLNHVHLGEFDREQCAADPQTYVRARLRSFMRQELEQFERWVLLQIYDDAWKNNLHSMDQLRDSIGFRGIAQKDPRIEFKKGAAETFNEMEESIRERASDILLKGRLAPQARPAQNAGLMTDAEPGPTAEQRAQIEQAEMAGVSGEPVKKELSDKAMKVVGRNEPCPCGSGKKYKACHGATA